jgi:hypothetical protein
MTLRPRVTTPAPADETRAARRLAAVVAAAAAVALPVWFWVTTAVWGLGDTPPPGAPAAAFRAFYVDSHAAFPMYATANIVMWTLLLVVLVAVVRAAVTRIDLVAVLAITLAGAATAVTVMAEGVLAWPALVTAGPQELTADLDPAVAQALVLSRDGLHGPALVLFGLALLLIAGLLARSDLWGHRTVAVLTAVTGGLSAAYILLGPESAGAILTVPWAIAMAVALLVDRARR